MLGIWNDMWRGLWGQVSISVGAPLGSFKGASFSGDLCVEEGSGDGHLSP